MRIFLFGFLIVLVPLFCQAQFRQVLSIGHSQQVTDVSFSSNSRFTITVSHSENKAIIWNTLSGGMIHVFDDPYVQYKDGFYSNTGKYLLLVTGGNGGDSAVLVLNPQTFELIYKIDLPNIYSVSFTPDDRYVCLSQIDEFKMFIYDGDSGNFLSTKDINHAVRFKPFSLFKNDSQYFFSYKIRWLKFGEENFIDSIVIENFFTTEKFTIEANEISKDGNYSGLLLCNKGSTKCSRIIIKNASSQKIVSQIKDIKDSSITDFLFSPDNKFILTVGEHCSIKLYELATGSFYGQLEFTDPAELNKIKIVNTHNIDANRIKFSKSGKYIIYTNTNDDKVYVWETRVGKFLYNVDAGSVGENFDFPFLVTSNDSDQFLSIVFPASNSSVSVFNLADGKKISRFSSHNIYHDLVGFANNKTSVIIKHGSNLKRLNLLSGEVEFTYEKPSIETAEPDKIQFSKSRNFFVTKTDSTIVVYKTDQRKFVNIFRAPFKSNFISFDLNESAQQFVVFCSNGSCLLVDLLTCRVIKSIKLAIDSSTSIYQIYASDPVSHSIAISSRNNLAIVTTFTKKTFVWDILNKKVDLLNDTFAILDPFLVYDDHFLVASDGSGNVYVWEKNKNSFFLKYQKFVGQFLGITTKGKQLVTQKNGFVNIIATLTGDITDSIRGNYATSIDGKICDSDTILIVNIQNEILYNALLKTRKFLRVSNREEDAIVNADLTYLVSITDFGYLIRDVQNNGDMKYHYVVIDENDYLVFDTLRRFDGSEKGLSLIYATCGDEIIELQQLKELSWEPSLVTKLMGINSDPITSKTNNDFQICGKIPVIIFEKSSGDSIYIFNVTGRVGGIGKVYIYAGKKLISEQSIFSSNNSTHIVKVRLSEIEDYLMDNEINQLILKASTYDESLISKGEGVIIPSNNEKPFRPPHLFCAFIGISKYKGPKIRLNYAARDANDFGKNFSIAARALFSYPDKDNVRTYFLTTENTVDSAAYWPTKDNIVKVLNEIKDSAKPDDIVLLFFSGHGVLNELDKRFYFLTQDALGFTIANIEKDVAISTDELKSLLKEIKAQKEVLILDACNSGQFLNDLDTKKSLPASQERALDKMRDVTGVNILTAAASGQYAFETSEYGQGLLTHSLLAGIKNGSGLKDGDELDLNTWFQYTVDNVKLESKRIDERQIPKLMASSSFTIGLAKPEIRDAINLPDKRILFGSCLLAEETNFGDSLEFTNMLNDELLGLNADKNSKVLFSNNFSGTKIYKIVGLYRVKGYSMVVRYSLRKGNHVIAKYKVHVEDYRRANIYKAIVEPIIKNLVPE